MDTRTSPFSKAWKEARMLLLPALLLAVGFNLFASNAIPWLREAPKIEEASDADLFGKDTANNALTPPVIDTLPSVDTTLSPEELEKQRQDSIKLETKRIQDSVLKAQKDSIKKAQEGTFGSVEAGEVKGIGTAKTKEIFDKKVAFFIDARRHDQFTKGHIPGSTNIYAYEFADNISKVINVPKDKLIVVYCDGGLCELSHDLAKDLITFGFKKIVIYTGGWEEWSATNYPKSTGE